MAELCFNTAMTGYQEIMTDPSYAGQIVTFTFPHIGNTGVTPEDDETADPVAAGMVVKWDPTEPSNWRASGTLEAWLARRGRIGIGGVDTRPSDPRDPSAGRAACRAQPHDPEGKFDLEALVAAARGFAGLEGLDLAQRRDLRPKLPLGRDALGLARRLFPQREAPGHKVVAIDYGAKRNILRCLASAGCDVTVLPATATAEEVLAHDPAGVFLSNGPGDPAATGAYAVPMIQAVLERDLPVFGICLGHQMLALALGARTIKMNHGHHGANHPVKDLETGKVEITSMNHGFTVDAQSLPDGVLETHVSLFDGSNCGIRLKGRPVFSVQYHPEASPGPMDSFYLFERFVAAMGAATAPA